jgi:hypothetical protein
MGRFEGGVVPESGTKTGPRLSPTIGKEEENETTPKKK